MTDGEGIYLIKQNKKLNGLWAEFTHSEKKLLVRLMQDRTEHDLEKTMLEIRTGQNRLF